MILGKEQEQARTLVDAIREMLGLQPLYAEDPWWRPDHANQKIRIYNFGGLGNGNRHVSVSVDRR